MPLALACPPHVTQSWQRACLGLRWNFWEEKAEDEKKQKRNLQPHQEWHFDKEPIQLQPTDPTINEKLKEDCLHKNNMHFDLVSWAAYQPMWLGVANHPVPALQVLLH